MKKAARRRTPAAGQVRIIAGRWRGRKLAVPDLPGLRPSADRGRETLFNWLQAELAGSRCLDLFAGSGVLGFEAASRGAAEVVMVDRSTEVVRSLQQHKQRLGADQVRIIQEDAPGWLENETGAGYGPFDIVFVDPPWQQACHLRVLAALAAGDWLQPGALVYLESPARQDAGLAEHAGWRVHREGRVGAAALRLLQCKKN